jgi:hypothetical protein
MAEQHEMSPTRPFKTKKHPRPHLPVYSGRPNIKWSFLRTLRKLFESNLAPENAKIPAKKYRDF